MKLCSRLYSTEIEFYSEKLKNQFLSHPLGGLRGNVRTPSTALWKACGRLSIRHNGTFSLSLTVETLQAEICRSRRFFEGGGSLSANISGGKGQFPATPIGVERLEISLFCMVLRY